MMLPSLKRNLWLLLPLALAAPALLADTVENARAVFVRPQDDARIMMRWWWFGPKVTDSRLEAEMRAMRDMGIGGFEIQPVYPLAIDGNQRYLSDEYLRSLRFTALKARELGLRMDVTLGSGWPFGGPHVPVTEAASRLRCDRVALKAGTKSFPMPTLSEGEALLAVFIARGEGKTFSAAGIEKLDVRNGAPRAALPAAIDGPRTALVFIASRTGQQVKRPANGAEGYVLDHLDRKAIDRHLQIVGERLMMTFAETKPYAVFSDSLEVYGSDWTGDFATEFKNRRGYDLIPLLPALLDGMEGELPDSTRKAADIRHDWGLTLTELCEERYLTPIREWAHRNGTRFRSQTYGFPPVTLSSNALVDLPEGEHGPYWRKFSVARWASSASHLYGRPVTSSETWTWLHSPVFRATPLDMKAEADRHFLQGINQLVGHGWPYSPPEVGEPGWRFYAAAVFNQHNPWWQVMPAVSVYLQRVSGLLRMGKPANDVALYLPTHDAYAKFHVAGRSSVNEVMDTLLDPQLIPQILDAGYNLDFIDDTAITTVGIPHPVLVIPNCQRLPAATETAIDDYKRRGLIVVDLRKSGGSVAEIARKLRPDFSTGVADVGFLHRKLDDGDVYFVANTGNQPVHAQARVRGLKPDVEWWDPLTGRRMAAEADANGRVKLDLAPYESRVLVSGKFPSTDPRDPAPASSGDTIADLSKGWLVTFGGLGKSGVMDPLHSWTDDESTLYYSGTASYERSFQYQPASGATKRVFLNFGEGKPVEPRPKAQGFAALLDAPVREAAIVVVNGKVVGSVWSAPYEIEITRLLKTGENQIKIYVSNLALNAMAASQLPDYKLLRDRYGNRFDPQDMDQVKPEPSGLLGRVVLLAR